MKKDFIKIGDREFSVGQAINIALAEIFEHCGGSGTAAYDFTHAVFEYFLNQGLRNSAPAEKER